MEEHAVCVIINNMIKKADIILFIIILLVGGVISWWSLFGSEKGDRVVIEVDGSVYGTYNLSEDKEIDIVNGSHTNHISIKGGTVQMTYSTCHNQICVDKGKISEINDMIVCLPNKVVISIESREGGEIDAVSN